MRLADNAKEGGNAVADQKPPPKRDEFQAFKSLTRKLVAVPKKEVERKVEGKARKERRTR